MEKLTDEKRKFEKENNYLKKKNDSDSERITNKYRNMVEDLNNKYFVKENERKLELKSYLNDKDFMIDKLKRGTIIDYIL